MKLESDVTELEGRLRNDRLSEESGRLEDHIADLKGKRSAHRESQARNVTRADELALESARQSLTFAPFPTPRALDEDGYIQCVSASEVEWAGTTRQALFAFFHRKLGGIRLNVEGDFNRPDEMASAEKASLAGFVS